MVHLYIDTSVRKTTYIRPLALLAMHKAHGDPPSPPAACSGLFIDVGANSGSSLHS